MKWFGRFLLVLIASFVFAQNNTYAEDLKFSIGPVCKNNKVVCKGGNEKPTCLVLNNKVHVETIEFAGGEKINKFQPSCGGYTDNLLPFCVDITKDSENAEKGVVLECIELAACKEENDKLVPDCPNGKISKCLGDNSVPNCLAERPCKEGSIPICDYEYGWQANVSDSSSYK